MQSVTSVNTKDFNVFQVSIFNASFIRENILKAMEAVKKAKASHKFQRCPLIHDAFIETNVSSNTKMDFERTLPNGDYRYEHKFRSDDDHNVFTKTVYETFNTGEYSFL